MNIDYYLKLATQAYEIGDNVIAKQYIQWILTLDRDNQSAMSFLDQLSVNQ